MFYPDVFSCQSLPRTSRDFFSLAIWKNESPIPVERKKSIGYSFKNCACIIMVNMRRIGSLIHVVLPSQYAVLGTRTEHYRAYPKRLIA